MDRDTPTTSSFRSARGGVRRLVAAAALFAVAAALYGALMWPAPRHFSSGIPFGSFATGALPREMQPGDHLQLMYHFDLMRQWLAGEVPFFSDPWEFNVAGAPPRRVQPPGYAPFSVPYAALAALGLSDAAAWNLLQAASVLVGLFFCFRLALRFGAGPVAALAAATLATCFPYRWTMLGHGSPTGFGMAFVPGVALGIDIAARDRKARGGVLAGALLAACWATDLHSFLFAGLALPVWFLAGLLRAPDAPLSSRRGIAGLVRALLPAAVAGAAVVAFAMASRGAAYSGTDVENGRSLAEIHLHSPEWGALVDPFFNCHAANRFFVGWPLLAAFAASVLLCLRALDRETVLAARSAPGGGGRRLRAAPRPFPGSRAGAAAAGLTLAVTLAFAVFLALGENGPGDAAALRLLRSALPPFRMVRQPIKVFCLAPALLSPLFALAFVGLLRRWRRVGAAALVVLSVAAVATDADWMHTGVCMLPGGNGAWDAAAADAAARGVAPRVLVLPIRDADQASASTCQYFALRSRVPALNGYSAVDDVAYTRDVVRKFDGMAGGCATPRQVAGLARCGVSHVLLSENGAFGPSDSPFPFAATLRRFFDNPAFRLVGSDDGWWAFAFDPEAETRPAPPARLPLVEYPAPDVSAWRQRPPARWTKVRAEVVEGAVGAGHGWIVQCVGEDGLGAVSTAEARDGTPYAASASLPDAPGGAPPGGRLLFVPSPSDGQIVKAGFETAGFGSVAFEAWTASGGIVESAPGAPAGSFRLDPGLFWHSSGKISGLRGDGTAAGLSFRRNRDSPSYDAAFGPLLPLALPAGSYSYRLVFTSGDPARGTDPGVAVHSVSGVSRPVSKGPCAGTFRYDGASPVCFILYWSGGRDCDLAAIEITPLPKP